MRRTTLLLCVLVSTVLGAEPKDPKTLDISAEKTDAAKVLVAKLTDADEGARVKAAKELTKMGREALPALLGARNAKPSEELRNRLDDLIPDARRADFDARAALFLADKERKYNHTLPGWNELRAAVKDKKESRALFADMLVDEPCRDMLLLAFDPTEDGKKQFRSRWEAKMKHWQAVFTAELKAGLAPQFTAPKPKEPLTWVLSALTAELLHAEDYRDGYRHAIVQFYLLYTDEGKLVVDGKGSDGELVREFIRYWVGRQHERFGLEDARAISRYMKFDSQVELDKVEKLFEIMVSTNQPNLSPGTLAHTRDPKYIASFRRLFDSDKPFCSPREGNKLPEIQMREMALAMCISLSGQDPTEYGFSEQNKPDPNVSFRFTPHNYYFSAGEGKTVDDKRKAAFKQWAEWEKANPDKLKAKAPDKK